MRFVSVEMFRRLGVLQSTNNCIMLCLCLLVFTTVLIAYYPVLSANAMTFDDDQYLTDNVLVRNPSWQSVRRFFSEVLHPSTVKGYYQPLSMVSLMIDYLLGGQPSNLLIFHFTSLILHTLNACLLMVLLYLLFHKPWISALVSMLFALHPVTVETVAWVAERKTLLAAFFSFLSIIFYIRYVRIKNITFFCVSIVAYLGAIMSKPISLPLPFWLLILDYWPLQRKSVQKCFLDKLPYFAFFSLFAIITFLSQNSAASAVLPNNTTLSHMVLGVFHNCSFYFRNIIYPISLSPYYGFPSSLSLSDPMVVYGMILNVGMVLIVFLRSKWAKIILTGYLFYFIGIFPTLGLIKFTDVIAADKYIYLPSISIAITLTYFFCWLYNHTRLQKSLYKITILTTIVATLLIIECVNVRNYLVKWKDSTSLYTHTLKFAPNSVYVLNNLGEAFLSQGAISEAKFYLDTALYIDPNDHYVKNNLALIFHSEGKTRLANAVSSNRVS